MIVMWRFRCSVSCVVSDSMLGRRPVVSTTEGPRMADELEQGSGWEVEAGDEQ